MDTMQLSGFKVVVNNNLVTLPRLMLKQKLQRILTEGGRGDAVESFNRWSEKFFGGQPPFLVDNEARIIVTNDMGLAFLQQQSQMPSL